MRIRICSLPILAFGLILVGCCETLRGQTMSLDAVAPIPLSSSGSVAAFSIDHATGNVIVRSNAGNFAQCLGPSSPIINSFAPTSSTVLPSAAITLNWTSSNTTSCSPSLGSGTVWTSLGTLFPPSGSRTFLAPASAGTITFQLDCTDGAQTVFATTQVIVQASTVPEISAFTLPVSAASCASNSKQTNSTIISWNSVNTAYCRASEDSPIRTNWSLINCIGNDCPDTNDRSKLRPLQNNQSLFILNGLAGQSASLTLICYSLNNMPTAPSVETILLRQPQAGECVPRLFDDGFEG